MILIVIYLEIVENKKGKKVDKFFFRSKVEEFVLIEKI